MSARRPSLAPRLGSGRSALPLAVVFSSALALLGGCQGDQESASGDDPWDLLGSGPTTRMVRASDDALAWRLERGACWEQEGERLCEYAVELTGAVGRGCSHCDDQVVEVTVRASTDSRLYIDSLKLVEGSGMPLGVGFDGLGIPLTPQLPTEVGLTYLLGVEFLGPDGPIFTYANWMLLEEQREFTDRSGTTWGDCIHFMYSPAFVSGYFDSFLPEPFWVTTCPGLGLAEIRLDSKNQAAQDRTTGDTGGGGSSPEVPDTTLQGVYVRD